MTTITITPAEIAERIAAKKIKDELIKKCLTEHKDRLIREGWIPPL